MNNYPNSSSVNIQVVITIFSRDSKRLRNIQKMFDPQHLKHIPDNNNKLFGICYRAVPMSSLGSDAMDRKMGNQEQQKSRRQSDDKNKKNVSYLVVPWDKESLKSTLSQNGNDEGVVKFSPNCCTIINYRNPVSLGLGNYQQMRASPDTFSYILLEGQSSLWEHLSSKNSEMENCSLESFVAMTEQEIWPLIADISEAMRQIWSVFGEEHSHLMSYVVRVIQNRNLMGFSNKTTQKNSYRDLAKSNYKNLGYKSEYDRELKRYKLIYHPSMRGMTDYLVKNGGEGWEKYGLGPQELDQLENRLKGRVLKRKDMQNMPSNRSVFSFGLLLLGILCQNDRSRLLYETASYSVSSKILQEKIRFVEELYSKNLVRVVKGCLELDPWRRIESVNHLGQEIKSELKKIGRKREKLLKRMVDVGMVKGIGFDISIQEFRTPRDQGDYQISSSRRNAEPNYQSKNARKDKNFISQNLGQVQWKNMQSSKRRERSPDSTIIQNDLQGSKNQKILFSEENRIPSPIKPLQSSGNRPNAVYESILLQQETEQELQQEKGQAGTQVQTIRNQSPSSASKCADGGWDSSGRKMNYSFAGEDGVELGQRNNLKKSINFNEQEFEEVNDNRYTFNPYQNNQTISQSKQETFRNQNKRQIDIGETKRKYRKQDMEMAPFSYSDLEKDKGQGKDFKKQSLPQRGKLSGNRVIECQINGKESSTLSMMAKNSSICTIQRFSQENSPQTIQNQIQKYENPLDLKDSSRDLNPKSNKLNEIMKQRSILRTISPPSYRNSLRKRKGLSLSREHYHSISYEMPEWKRAKSELPNHRHLQSQKDYEKINLSHRNPHQEIQRNPSERERRNPSENFRSDSVPAFPLSRNQEHLIPHINRQSSPPRNSCFQIQRQKLQQITRKLIQNLQPSYQFPTYPIAELSCPEHFPHSLPICNPNSNLELLTIQLFLSLQNPMIVHLQKVIKEVTGIETGVWIDGDLYFGEMQGGRRNGLGLQIFPGSLERNHSPSQNRNLLESTQEKGHSSKQEFYFGYFVEDLFHGQGFYQWNYKDYFIGKFEAGQKTEGFLHGERLQYQGEFKNGKRDGYGCCWYRDGSFYEGKYLNGKKQGKCQIMVQPTGDIFIGIYQRNKRKGLGTVFSPSVRIVGMWRGEDRIQGDAQIFQSGENGGYYKGKLEPGTFMKEGDGQYHFGRSGAKFVGQFEKDSPVQGKMTYKNGETYRGGFKKMKRNGYGEYRYSDGSAYKGIWVDDRKMGEARGTGFQNQ